MRDRGLWKRERVLCLMSLMLWMLESILMRTNLKIPPRRKPWVSDMRQLLRLLRRRMVMGILVFMNFFQM